MKFQCIVKRTCEEKIINLGMSRSKTLFLQLTLQMCGHVFKKIDISIFG